MMPQQYLFRQPVNTEDSPDDQAQASPDKWSPPDYAKPIETKSGGAWKPPDYAKPLKEPESEHDKAKKNVTFAGSLKSSAKFTADQLKDSKLGQFLSGVAAVPESMYESVRDIGRTSANQLSSGDVHGAFQTVTKPLMGPIDTVNKMLEDKALGKSVDPISKEQSRHEIASQIFGAVGLPWDELVKSYKSGNYSKLAGIGLSTIALTGLAHYIGGEKSPQATPERELPIRQIGPSKASALRDTTPQQDAVAIAQTKDAIPRTPANISAETGIPKPSVRRTLSEIKKKTSQPESAPEPQVEASKATNVADYIEQNPTAKMSDIEQFIKSLEESKTQQAPAPETSQAETPPIQQPKPFINPFEKKPIEQSQVEDTRPLPTRSPNLAADITLSEPIKDASGRDIAPPQTPSEPSQIRQQGLTEQQLYDLARQKTGMGLEPPAQPEETPKTSEWKPPEYAQPLEAKTTEQPKVEEPQSSTDETVEMHGGLGGVGGGRKRYPKSTGPQGPVLDKLFQATLDAKDKMVEQEGINKLERAQRFAKAATIQGGGVEGAAKRLSVMKGEYNKVNPGERLQLNQQETGSLFDAIDSAKITSGEKLRASTALFKLLNGDGVPVRSELSILDDVFGNSFASRITEMHGGIGAIGLQVGKLSNTMKQLENSASLAPALRHGASGVLRPEFYPAARDMYKFMTDKEFFNQYHAEMKQDPMYLHAKESGLFFINPGSLMNSDEEWLNSYIGDIPKQTGIPMAVGASQRGYTGFLNKFRFDVFKNMAKTAKSLGFDVTESTPLKNNKGEFIRDASGKVKTDIVSTKAGRAIANLINVSTGRGDLGKLNKATNELNMLFYSPRMIASRFQMFNPKLYIDLPPGMRIDGLKFLLGRASLGLAITGLSAAAGAKMNFNILSTDFGKSRFGNHVVDPWQGFQQPLVLTARLIAGRTDSNRPTTRGEILGAYLHNQEAPLASFIHGMAFAKAFTGEKTNPPDTLRDVGQTFSSAFGPPDPKKAGSYVDEYGQKTSVQKEFIKKFMPIMEQDLQTLIETEPDWSKNIGLDAAMATAGLFGMSQNYPEKKTGKLSLGKMRLR